MVLIFPPKLLSLETSYRSFNVSFTSFFSYMYAVPETYLCLIKEEKNKRREEGRKEGRKRWRRKRKTGRKKEKE